jgi:hypothetical protein
MAETRATKKEFLEFIEDREIVTAHQLTNWFGYSYSYACKRLSLLKKQGLVENPARSCRGQWCLTVKGCTRVDFLRRREQERQAVIKNEEAAAQKEIASLKKRIEELEKERPEVEEPAKVSRGSGEPDGEEVRRLLKEFEKSVAAYAWALKHGVKLGQVDLEELRSRAGKLLRYNYLLPPAEKARFLRMISPGRQ